MALLLIVSPLSTFGLGAAVHGLGVTMAPGWLVSAVLCSVMGLVIALTTGLAAGTLMGLLASQAMVVGLHAVVGEAFAGRGIRRAVEALVERADISAVRLLAWRELP